MQARSTCSSRVPAPAARPRSVRCRPQASRSAPSPMSPRSRTTAAVRPSGAGSEREGGNRTWLGIPAPSPASRVACSVDLVGGDQAFERRPYPPGQHGRARIKESEYLLQLQEKQKARFTYGVMEKQFRRYYEEANRRPGKTGDNLLQILEIAAGQRRLPRRAGPHPSAGPPARQPRPLPGQRQEGQHPELPRLAVRHHRLSRRSRWPRCRSRSRARPHGDRPIPGLAAGRPGRLRILVHQLPERAQIDVAAAPSSSSSSSTRSRACAGP